MTALRFDLHSAGVLAPGIGSLAELRAIQRGEQAYAHAPLAVPSPAVLPAQERRRATAAVKLVLACAGAALEGCDLDPAHLPTVFATDEGTGEVCQQMLEALATTRQVSPLVFSNSVVNAPSGYLSIAFGNREPAIVVSLGLESFAGGLLCAVTEARARRKPVLFSCYDAAMTPPMDELLPIREATATAWVISSGLERPLKALASFELELQDAAAAQRCTALPSWMPAGWAGHASARALAALALLDGGADAQMAFAFANQSLALRRVAGEAE